LAKADTLIHLDCVEINLDLRILSLRRGKEGEGEPGIEVG